MSRRGPGIDDARDLLRVAQVAARGLLRSRLPSMSAALAFRTLFALVPVVVISLVIVRAVAGPEGVENGVRRVLDYSGVTALLIAEPASERSTNPTTETDAEPEQQDSPNSERQESTHAEQRSTPERAADQASPTDPDEQSADSTASAQRDTPADGRLNDWVTDRVEQIMTVSLPAIGAVGFAALIYAAISLLIEIERSFNHVYRVRASRSWLRRLTQYWTILTLGGFFLFGTFYAGDQFQFWAAGVLDSNATGVVLRFLGFCVTVVISTVLFFLSYQTIVSARVHVRAALAGALVGALLWEIGKWGLTQSVSYFADSSAYAKIYGALALVPLFMLWVNYTWLIVLFGLQVTFGLQHLSTWQQNDHEESGPALADPAAVIALAAFVADRFESGQAASIEEAASATGLPADAAHDLLDRLVDAGLLHTRAEDAASLSLSRPAETIPLEELIRVGRAATEAGSEQDAIWAQAWTRIQRAQDAAVGNQTLADVLTPENRQPTTPKS